MRNDTVSVVGLSMPDRLIREIDALADREMISRSAVLRRAIMNWLAQEKHRDNTTKRRRP